MASVPTIPRHARSPRIRESLRHLAQLAHDTIPPMHPAGRPFVAGGLAATLLLRRLSPTAGVLGAVAATCCAAFFRDPLRVPPQEPGLAVAPADGTVSNVGFASVPAELATCTELDLPDEPLLRVSIFLSIFDVHVQRIPVDGEVRAVAYRPGRFLSADLNKASEVNERNSVWLHATSGHDVVVVQIAGLIARRIVCSVQPGDQVSTATTYGLIRFGSRVDLYLPPGSEVMVRPGQRTIGGETPLAQLPASGVEWLPAAGLEV